MGCASSKVLGIAAESTAEQGGNYGYARGISMPTHLLQELPEDFHIVALTSSTYGILKVDAPKAPEEEERGKDAAMAPHSVKEVLSKLSNMESKGTEAGPQSWLEVSSMLENLKPDLEQKAAPKGATAKTSKPLDSIDINEIMMDLDEDTGLVKPQSVLARRAHLKKAGNSLPIYTLEELDKRIGGGCSGKDNSIMKNPSLPAVVTDLRASLKPVAARTTVTKSSTGYLSAKSPICRQTSPSAERDGSVGGKDNKVFDDDFLESYSEAFHDLSAGDWNVLEMHQEGESGLEQGVEGVKDATTVHASTDNGQVAATSNPQAEEGQTKTVSEQENSPLELFNASFQSSPSVAAASPLESFEDSCPPGGKHAVVLYTTSLRGMRKTYEDCNRVREILQGFGVIIDERDVSMHLEYRNELRELMQRLVTVPRLFIEGKYIGGAEKVCKLQEEGQLACLFEGSTKMQRNQEGPCDGCANARFVPCFECNGSRKKVMEDNRQVTRCLHCNENGLVVCPICS